MMNLATFRNEMQSLMEELKIPNLRPFVCEGSPLECEVFIVGSNPATEMSTNPWKYWSDDYGFYKSRWFEEYKDERKKRPLKPGRTRRNKISRTRKRINLVVEGACPVKCLETNIYAKPSENEDDLEKYLKTLSLEDEKRLIAPFDYLLKQIRPKLVVSHGDKAKDYLQRQVLECELWSECHFSSRGSRGYTDAKARELGLRIHKFFYP